ncbi:MAG: Spy/CpxP family protein refolding chaperone [Pyrinomonadaceae bacterium]
MKKQIITLAIILFATSVGLSQSSGEEKPRTDGKQNSLRRYLDLTDAQVQSLREIKERSEDDERAARKKANAAKKALDEAIYDNETSIELVRQRANEVSKANAEVTRLQAEREFAVRQILTSEQLEKFRKLRNRMDSEKKEREKRRENVRNRMEQREKPKKRD